MLTNDQVIAQCDGITTLVYDLTCKMAVEPKTKDDWAAYFTAVATVVGAALTLAQTTRRMVKDGYPW